MRVASFLSLFTVAAMATIASTASAAIITGSASETIVESRTGGKNFAAYSDTAATVTNNSWTNSTAKSTAPGLTAGIGSRFNSNAFINNAAYFQVAPTLPTAGGIYDVYVSTTNGSGANVITAGITVTGGTGLPATTTAFSTASQNTWLLVGQLDLDPGVTVPTIRFNEVANSNRFYADGVLFAEVAVPEPATLALAGMGLIGICSVARRKNA